MSLHQETYGPSRKNFSSAADLHTHFQEGAEAEEEVRCKGNPAAASRSLICGRRLDHHHAGYRVRAALIGHARQVDPPAPRRDGPIMFVRTIPPNQSTPQDLNGPVKVSGVPGVIASEAAVFGRSKQGHKRLIVGPRRQ